MRSKQSSDLAEMITRIIVQTRAAMLQRESSHKTKHMAAGMRSLPKMINPPSTDLLKHIAEAPKCPPWLKAITESMANTQNKEG